MWPLSMLKGPSYSAAAEPGGARAGWARYFVGSDEFVLLNVLVPGEWLIVYSITWSVRASSDGGIVRPRAFAVLRLITSSNLVGCSTGRSPGLAPLRIRST